MPNRRIALIVADEANRALYLAHLTRHPGFELEPHVSVTTFAQQAAGKAYCGIVADIGTLIRSQSEEKRFFADLCQSFPILRVRPGPDPGSLSGLVEGKNLGRLSGPELVERFLGEVCAAWTPRGVRTRSRRQLVISAEEFRLPPPGGQDGRRVSLGDLSLGGCFVITPHPGQEGERRWLTLPDRPDLTALEVAIKWVIPWGQPTQHLPGYGGRFQSISETQRLIVAELVARGSA